jgi:uncharacterized membrane protein
LPRFAYLDRARGLAVLLMIEAHTLDAWTRPVDRDSSAGALLTIVGGCAAPLFLWLAGLSAALSASRALARCGNRTAAVESVSRRGLEIFILAFAFRLQAFMASPGGPAISLFRVDILNVMGPALVASAIVWGLARSTAGKAIALAAAAAVIAVATPVVRDSSAVAVLPTWVQWYLRPAGEHTTFTLLPWAGFVFGGAAAGVLVDTVRGEGSLSRLHAPLVGAGALLIAIGLYTATRPPLFAHASFWTSSPTFFAVRAGALLIAVSAFAFSEAVFPAKADGREGWLARFGRSSLFIYWIHVELVYGYATWPVHHALPVWGTLAGCGVFVALMYRAVLLRDLVVASWRNRGARRRLQTA